MLISDLHKDLHKAELFTQTSGFGFIYHNPKKQIILINKGFTEIFGYAFEEILEKNLDDIFDAQNVNINTDTLIKDAEYGKVKNLKYWLKAKTQTYKWIRLSISPVSDANNTTIGYTWLISDCTSEKKKEEKLANYQQELLELTNQLSREKQELEDYARTVSHNLRSPIGNLQALLSLYKNEHNVHEKEEIFRRALNASENLNNTLNSISDTIKNREGEKQKISNINFDDIYKKVREMVEPEINQTGCIIKSDFSSAPNINYYKVYMESIFLNLITNSVKYRSNARTPVIEISTYNTEKGILLVFSDNGQGMDMNKVGNQLFGLHNTFHGNKDAHGVGLFLIKNQIEAMGGQITVESEPSKGTTFKIVFNK